MQHMPALLATLAVACALAGCTGMSASYPSYAIAPAEHIQVIPVTAEFIARERQVAAEESQPIRMVGANGAAEAAAAASEISAKTVPDEANAPYLYRIRPTDVLDISVPAIVTINTPSAPTILGEQGRGYVVYDDGTIYLPFSGAIGVAGLTPREVQEQVVKALSKYLKTPDVIVSVREFRSQRVMVTGQVERPGYLPVTDVPLTLLGALSTTGGVARLRGRADPRLVGSGQGQSQSLSEYPDLHRVVLKRDGNDRKIDVERILKTGAVHDDVVLRGGDVVLVPTASRANIFVLGEVLRPAMLEIAAEDTSLAQVLMASGGVNQLTANATRVYVIRGEFTKPIIYQFNTQSPDAFLLAQQFDVRSRDVVYVAEAAVTRWNRFLQQILPAVQGLLSTAVIANTVDEVQN